MKRLWEREYILRANDFDKFNHIKPSAVLELFQDAAGQHAEEIGVGFDAMIQRSYLWVLTRIKFKMLISPVKYQRVIVKTWPLVPNKLVYRREYSIENEHGEKLIARWVYGMAIYNGSETKQFTWSKENFYFVDKPCEKRNPGYPLDSISIMPEYNKYFVELTQEEKKSKTNNEDNVIDFIVNSLV